MTTYEPTEQDQVEGLNYTIRVQKRTDYYIAHWDNGDTVPGLWHGRGTTAKEAMVHLISHSPLPYHDQA
jgi:hypothetical protein